MSASVAALPPSLPPSLHSIPQLQQLQQQHQLQQLQSQQQQQQPPPPPTPSSLPLGMPPLPPNGAPPPLSVSGLPRLAVGPAGLHAPLGLNALHNFPLFNTGLNMNMLAPPNMQHFNQMLAMQHAPPPNGPPALPHSQQLVVGNMGMPLAHTQQSQPPGMPISLPSMTTGTPTTSSSSSSSIANTIGGTTVDFNEYGGLYTSLVPPTPLVATVSGEEPPITPGYAQIGNAEFKFNDGELTKGGAKRACFGWKLSDGTSWKIMHKVTTRKNFSNKANIQQYERGRYLHLIAGNLIIVVTCEEEEKHIKSKGLVGLNYNPTERHPLILLSSQTRSGSVVKFYHTNPQITLDINLIKSCHESLSITCAKLSGDRISCTLGVGFADCMPTSQHKIEKRNRKRAMQATQAAAAALNQPAQFLGQHGLPFFGQYTHTTSHDGTPQAIFIPTFAPSLPYQAAAAAAAAGANGAGPGGAHPGAADFLSQYQLPGLMGFDPTAANPLGLPHINLAAAAAAAASVPPVTPNSPDSASKKKQKKSDDTPNSTAAPAPSFTHPPFVLYDPNNPNNMFMSLANPNYRPPLYQFPLPNFAFPPPTAPNAPNGVGPANPNPNQQHQQQAAAAAAAAQQALSLPGFPSGPASVNPAGVPLPQFGAGGPTPPYIMYGFAPNNFAIPPLNPPDAAAAAAAAAAVAQPAPSPDTTLPDKHHNPEVHNADAHDVNVAAQQAAAVAAAAAAFQADEAPPPIQAADAATSAPADPSHQSLPVHHADGAPKTNEAATALLAISR